LLAQFYEELLMMAESIKNTSHSQKEVTERLANVMRGLLIDANPKDIEPPGKPQAI